MKVVEPETGPLEKESNTQSITQARFPYTLCL